MSFVGNLFGGSGGSNASNIQNPTNSGQITNAYDQQQSGLNQQQQFVNALQGSNGIQNQQNVFGQQQQLANQLQGVANGTGPNPALQQLQNTTGQNVQNQAALMAGQRGTGANAGLLARQAAMQGAGIQQQAVGQGAALGAQQQLAGMNALQNQQQLMGNTAQQQISNQGGALAGLNQYGLQGQSNLMGAQANYNNTQAGLASNTQQAQNSMFGGLLGGAGSGASMLASPSLENAGELMAAAQGGVVPGPKSKAAQFLKGGPVPGKASVQGNSYSNDTVPAVLSPGEIVLPRSVTQSEDPMGNASKFVAAVMAKKGMGGKK